MTNEIPQHLFKEVKAVFDSFDRNGDGVLKGNDEVVQDNKKRQKLGQGSIYRVNEDMDINSFYKENKSIFSDHYATSYGYNDLYAESQFRDADLNHNGKISKREAKKAKKNDTIGQLFKPRKGETIEEYKSRIMPEVMKTMRLMRNDYTTPDGAINRIEFRQAVLSDLAPNLNSFAKSMGVELNKMVEELLKKLETSEEEPKTDNKENGDTFSKGTAKSEKEHPKELKDKTERNWGF